MELLQKYFRGLVFLTGLIFVPLIILITDLFFLFDLILLIIQFGGIYWLQTNQLFPTAVKEVKELWNLLKSSL